jgi:hypothetical protein
MRRRMDDAPARRSRLAFFALAFVVFAFVFPYQAWVGNPNENVRVYTTMALVESGTLRIDGIVARHGKVNDAARVVDPATGEAHLYSVKAPATSFVGVPVYWAMTVVAPLLGHPVPDASASEPARASWLFASVVVLRLFTVQLPCFAFLVWLERWLRGTTADPVLRLLAVAGAGLGTNYLAYALMYVSHASCACAAFASFALTYGERRERRDARFRRKHVALLAGLLAGTVTLLEYHALPLSVVLALYALSAFWRPSRLVWLAVGGAATAAVMMLFQWRAFGSPWTPGHRLIESPVLSGYLNQGLFGIGRPDLSVAWRLGTSRELGLFALSPFLGAGLLAALLGVAPRTPRELRVATWVWLAAMAALWVTASGIVNWRGGWTVGPRYLGAAPPFFAFGAACALERFAGGSPWRRAVARGAAGGLVLAGVACVGLVGLHFGSVPAATQDEGVTRPLAQFTLPLAGAGFVPHHAGELFGWTSTTPWFVAAACLGASALVAAVARSAGEPAHRWLTRLAVVAVFAAAGVAPSFSPPQPAEGGDAGVRARRKFASTWEPAGRDRIAILRALAEQHGADQPCLWLELADLERRVEFTSLANSDASRAGTPPPRCE